MVISKLFGTKTYSLFHRLRVVLRAVIPDKFVPQAVIAVGLKEKVDLPTSWTNYLGVEDTCVVVNHTAGGYMFYKTPEYHRVTRFRGNSVPMDRPPSPYRRYFPVSHPTIPHHPPWEPTISGLPLSFHIHTHRTLPYNKTRKRAGRCFRCVMGILTMKRGNT